MIAKRIPVSVAVRRFGPFDRRMEMSEPIRSLTKLRGFRTVAMERDGLGPWSAMALEIGDLGFLVAAPKAEPKAGASVWFSGKTDARDIAAILTGLLDGKAPSFISEEGDDIIPDPKSAKRFRSLSSSNPPYRKEPAVTPAR